MAFCMGMLLVTAVLFMGDTMYILDAIVSSFGYYIWYLPNIAWETDAWARLGVKHRWSSNGGATGSIIVDTEDFGPPDGRGASSEWMHSWTIFYWGWWISWGPCAAREGAPRARRLLHPGKGVRGEGGVSLSPAAAASGTIVPRRNYSAPIYL